MQDAGSVYVVLVLYNNENAIHRCMVSLQEITYPNAKVVLIDNLSPDGGGPRLKAGFPTCHFIANDRNLGFARGCNVGIRYALEHGADYVLLLNGDMTVEPDFLEPMVELMAADLKAGLASGKIFHQHSRELLWYAGGHIDFWRGQLVTPEWMKHDTDPRVDPYKTNFCTGAMMFVRKSVLEDVGFLPEEYFFGVEEWDYSVQVQRHGYDLYVVPQAIAYHIVGASQDLTNAKWQYNFYRNKLIFQRKFLSKPLYGLWWIRFVVYVHLILRYRAARLQGDRLSAEELVFAGKQALADQKGTSPVFEEDLVAFEQKLEDLRSGTAGRS